MAAPNPPDTIEPMDQIQPETLTVSLGDRSYDIRIGTGLIAAAGAEIGPVLARNHTIIVTDENVAPLYLDMVRGALDTAGISTRPVILPPGEETKNFDGFRRLVEAVLEARPDRGTTLIALGGGVIGDLTGFAASVVLRGIDFVQIPTTLLAQVDSAVGGKTGIDTVQGKNLVGSFYQPRLVLADIGALASLPPRELRAGYAEIVKYGLINDAPFFAWLEKNGARLLAGDTAALQYAVRTSCAAKSAIVAADERESGVRALLNLGHTFGHALEAALGYGEALRHGEAVAIGMVLALELSARLGLCDAGEAIRLRQHLTAVGLPSDMAGLTGHDLDTQTLLHHMAHDKKVRDGQLTFILARGIGAAFMANDVDIEQVRALLTDAARA